MPGRACCQEGGQRSAEPRPDQLGLLPKPLEPLPPVEPELLGGVAGRAGGQCSLSGCWLLLALCGGVLRFGGGGTAL